jgi:FkbM family methyltransferase
MGAGSRVIARILAAREDAMSESITLLAFDYLTRAFARTFVDYMKEYERFSLNYARLMRNLTQSQQAFLLTILSRYLLIHHSPFFSERNFTEEELLEQGRVRKQLHDRIEKDGDYFRYQDFLLPIKHFETSVFYYRLGLERVADKSRVAGKDVIDAGAFIGDSALVLSTLAPRKVYAFEPVANLYRRMAETVHLNRLEAIIQPVNMGLSSRAGESEIIVDESPSASASAITHPGLGNKVRGARETARTCTVDAFVAEKDLDVGLIKMDTEGSELEILKGAENTIKKHKPVLLVSLYHNAEEFFEAKPLIESFNPGYRFSVEKFNPFSLTGETMLICEPT